VGDGHELEKVSAVDDFSATAGAYGMKGYSCDGLDVLEVRATIEKAVSEARLGRPSVVEARTYRYKGHSMSDPQKYRTREEIDEYRKRDAIQSFVAKLTGEKILSEEEWKDMIQHIGAQIEEAVAFAEESPEPSLSELYTDIYA